MTLLACEEMVVTGISGVSQSTCCFPESHFGLSLFASEALCSMCCARPAAGHLPGLSPSQWRCCWAVTVLPQGGAGTALRHDTLHKEPNHPKTSQAPPGRLPRQCLPCTGQPQAAGVCHQLQDKVPWPRAGTELPQWPQACGLRVSSCLCSLGKVSVSYESCSTRSDSLSTKVSCAAMVCLSVRPQEPCSTPGLFRKHWAGPGNLMVLPPPRFRVENVGKEVLLGRKLPSQVSPCSEEVPPTLQLVLSSLEHALAGPR